MAMRSSGKDGPAYIQVTLTEVQAVKEDLKSRRKSKGDDTELYVGVGSCRLLSRGVASNPFTPSIKKGRDEKRIVEASPGIMT